MRPTGGYLLDKEMGDTELLYRDQRDYQSKYRSVIEYFDAVKIALTATPALQTTEIFGQPVFKYTYREAVIEGYLVDHDAPHNLHTRLRDEGIHYRSGDTITIYDPLTGEITNSELLDDELDFDVEQFNKRVITRPFNEAVLAEIAQYIDPENPEEQGKTLIYAVDDPARRYDCGYPQEYLLRIRGGQRCHYEDHRQRRRRKPQEGSGGHQAL